MYGPPMFELRDAASIMAQVDACRRTFPNHYVKVNAFDATHGWESLRLSFIVNRPKVEPGFELRRQEGPGRLQRYGFVSYATARPEGERYR
jgi:ribulose-bisphosphate carboxylase small chain